MLHGLWFVLKQSGLYQILVFHCFNSDSTRMEFFTKVFILLFFINCANKDKDVNPRPVVGHLSLIIIPKLNDQSRGQRPIKPSGIGKMFALAILLSNDVNPNPGPSQFHHHYTTKFNKKKQNTSLNTCAAKDCHNDRNKELTFVRFPTDPERWVNAFHFWFIFCLIMSIIITSAIVEGFVIWIASFY